VTIERCEYPNLTPTEQHQLLIEWNQTQADYPRSQSIHQVFETQVQKTPNSIAAVFPERQGASQVLTYRELNQRANYLAQKLEAQGVVAGTFVAMLMERSLEMVVALLGILKVGGVYVPLDPAYPPDRLEWMLIDTQAPILLTQSRLQNRLPLHNVQVICLEEGWGSDRPESIPSISVPVSDDGLAYINYTSGSTGRPKGVAVPHRAVLRLVFGTDFTPLDAERVWLQLAPISFDAATLEIWGALLQGGQCVLFPGSGLPDPNELQQVIQQYSVTSMWITAALFNALITEAPQTLRGVKEILTGGEALSVSHIRSAQAQLPETQFVNGYGPTENTTFTCCYRIPRPLPGGISSIPIGRPIGNTQIYILDPQLHPVPRGATGELYIGGIGLAVGYINRPDLTAERFIPNPFSDVPDSKLYKTGDLVRYLPDGNVEFIGRTDSQVKIRGFRIELGEIEAVLSQHSAVRDAVVLVYEEGSGNKRLVAYVTPTPDQSLDLSQIKAYLGQHLAEYMVPSILMMVDKIPLTPNGKADRKALPQPKLGQTDADFVAPSTQMERSLADLWCGVLGLEQVGIEDNFFDLGGTSILGLQLVSRIQAHFNLTFRAVKLYQYPTIRTLAEYLAQEQNRQDKAPVLHAQPQTSVQSTRAIASEGIAIIGMVGRFPGADNIDQLWQNLSAGMESITFFSKDEIDASVDPDLRDDPNYVPAKGIIQDAETFDAAFFGISPREAEVMDPQARVLLELAQAALENAGYTPEQYAGQIGLYAGSGQNTYFERHICGRSEILNRLGAFQTMLANEKDFVTTRISYKLNLTGPSVSINTACSTSLVAAAAAFKALMNGECDIALAGGISINTPQNTGYLYQEGSMLSPDGHCRSFDAEAQGTTFNSGAGLVVLKRLTEALDAGDRIYAVIKGVGINNDGSDKVSFTAPSVNGQAGAILQAQSTAGVHPESISYIEAHGTATPLGDPIEIEALTQAFRQQTNATQYCAIGSIKSNIGHTVAAAGVAGLIKTALALHHKQLPPSLGFTSPNPQIDFANSPFYVNTKLMDWPEGETPRRAGVSSFGVGGTNAHVVLEEAPAMQLSSPSRPYQLLLLSAKTSTALTQAKDNLKSHLQQHPEFNLADVAYTLRVGRKAFNQRRFVVCREVAEATTILESLDVTRSSARETQLRNPDVVFMFPGQGSQYVNMGANLYHYEPVFQDAVDRCAAILQPFLKQDIREILYPSVEDEEAAEQALRQTLYTQPALFTIEYALAQLWMSWGVKPAAMIGHSIGEFVAACLADVFTLEDGLKLIATRGRMMWELPGGSMLSVRLPAETVAKRLSKDMAIAAINGPSLCVISGPTESVAVLQTELEAEEVICKTLYTSHAFHSPMMDAIVEPFADLLRSIPLSPPKIPFVSTVTTDWITTEQATAPLYWARHLRETVRFAEGVKTLWQMPERVLLEVGPRLTATTLARQQATDLKRQVAIASLGTTAEDNGEWLALMQAIGQLWLAGVEIDVAAFFADEYRHRLPLPTYPFERQRYWIDPKPFTPEVTPLAVAVPIPAVIEQEAIVAAASPAIQTESNSYTSPLSQLMIQPEALTNMSDSRKQRLMPTLKEVLETTSGLDFSGVDNTITFLEMGLDSLSLTQVALALKKQFKVKIAFRNLLEDYPNLDTLADFLDQSLPADAFPAPSPSTDSSPVSTTSISPTMADQPSLPSNGVAQNSWIPQSSIAQPMASTASIAPNSAVEALVAQQLQLMAQQLQLLGQSPAGIMPAASFTTPASSPLHPAPTPTPAVVEATVTPATAQTNGADTSTAKAPTPETMPYKSKGPGAKIDKSNNTALTADQQDALKRIIDRYISRTPESKRQTQEHRRYLADPRTVSGFSPLLKEMVYPIVTERASGSKLWDVDGNEYVDITNGFGLNFFGWSPSFVTEAVKAQLDKGIEIGPQTPLAGRVAKLFCEMTGMERAAFCNTGSEAVMATLRLARTVTGRNLVATFTGDYHGTFDEVLYRPGANLRTLPAAPGILPSMFENLLVLDYGTPESLEILRNRADDLAAILVEPVRSRDPGCQPKEFLQELRQITERSETAFIFDEVVTGFRVHPGGAQAYFGIQADLATYGKIVGGGLPIGVLAGKAEYMDALDGGFWQYGDDSIPEVGVTFFAGTFVRHPMAMAAAEAVLLKLKESGPDLQRSLAEKVDKFATHLNQHFERVGAPIKINHFTSFFYIDYPADYPHAQLLFYLLREKGVHVWDHRPCFFTLSHTEEDVEFILRAFKDSVAELQTVGFLPGASASFNGNGNGARSTPPQPGARLGKDPQGNPAWYIPDPDRPGKYLQVGGGV
jgi:amino acid adenylation domain-containing protein